MTSKAATRSRMTRRVLIAVGVLTAAAIAGAIWFLGRGSPDTVGIDSAASEVETANDVAAPSGSVDGRWNVERGRILRRGHHRHVRRLPDP